MENASKALIMAGSVLLSMIIIGALIFMFNNLRQVEQGEVTSEEVKKQVEYNKKIETFNRTLYGSELISLANFIADYESREVEIKKYDKIELIVNLESVISSTNKTKLKKYTEYEDLLKDFKKLDDEIEKWKKGKDAGYIIKINNTTQITADKIAGMRDSELTQLIEQAGGSTTVNAEILRDKAQTYSNLKLELTNFKNRRFKVINVKYSPDNNRIIKLEYQEIPA